MGALIEVNTDGLAKLAETVGGWFGWNARAIEHNAEAEAYATVRKVDAENAANLARLQGEEQVESYILTREKRKMNNVQNVVEQAQQHFVDGEQVSDEPVNQDWLNRFFNIVEDVSDAEMQQLWARILAGEVKKTKSYSLRTLEVLRNMTKEEANLFVKAKAYVIDDSFIINRTEYMSVQEMLLLEDIGLINSNILTKYYTLPPIPFFIIPINKKYALAVTKPITQELTVEIPVKSLTPAGVELLKLVETITSNEVYKYIAKVLYENGCTNVIKHKIKEWNPGSNIALECEGEKL